MAILNYMGREHFGLMRIKDSKAMHFISIKKRNPWGRKAGGTRGINKQRNNGDVALKAAGKMESMIRHN